MKVSAASGFGKGVDSFSTVDRLAEEARLLETMRRELRPSYDRLADEPIPSLFAQILDRLEWPRSEPPKSETF